MKAGVESSISKTVFLVLMAVSAVVLCMFYFVGYDNQIMIASQTYTDPENTDALMWWMYIITAICAVLMVVFLAWQFFSTLKNDPKGAVKGIFAFVALAVLVGVSYGLASDETIIVNKKPFSESGKLILTDVCIYMQYALLVITTVLTVLLGAVKSFNKVKA